MDFKNSTDYFSALIDEGNKGSSNWNPLVLGLAKKTLSWRGTYSGTTESRLRPDNIMWTVAKNVTADTPSIIPVLITRNVLATSLRTRLSKNEMRNELKFDKTVKTPLGHNFVVIRKDGSMFKATNKYTAYGVVYRGTSFNETTNNRPLIKYLTPYSEVTPDNH